MWVESGMRGGGHGGDTGVRGVSVKIYQRLVEHS